MKLQHWWLPVIPALLGAILIAVYPPLRHSLQLTVSANSKSSSAEQPSANSKTAKSTGNTVSLADEVYQKVNPAVVTVFGANGLGSGMILRSDGLILTNKHIVDNFANVSVKTANGKMLEGKVVDFDLQYDLALVKLNQPRLALPTVTLAATVNLKAGDRIYALGSPGGKAGTLTTGTFTRITPHGSLKTSAGLLNSGNSGGPLLNEQGVVVGVNKGLLEDKSGLATSISSVHPLLKRYEASNP